METRTDAYSVLVGKPERKRPLQSPGRNEKLILECTFKEQNVGVQQTDLPLDRDGQRNLFQYGNELSGSTKREVLHRLKKKNVF
jgi:hypothetical protein